MSVSGGFCGSIFGFVKFPTRESVLTNADVPGGMVVDVCGHTLLIGLIFEITGDDRHFFEAGAHRANTNLLIGQMVGEKKKEKLEKNRGSWDA